MTEISVINDSDTEKYGNKNKLCVVTLQALGVEVELTLTNV